MDTIKKIDSELLEESLKVEVEELKKCAHCGATFTWFTLPAVLGRKPAKVQVPTCKCIEELEEKFPARQLPEGAIVSRVAPSPTGFMHLGTLYQMMIAKKLAQQSDGVFMLRIEDTDTKREVEGAVAVILKCAKSFNLIPDEGPEYGGEYGPYYQSMRKDVYHSVAAYLLERGLAYPCFLTQ